MNDTVEQPTIAPPRDPLLDLAKRLIEPTDRDSYADLVYWFRSLPPNDEMIKLAQLLGFVTLIGSQLPEAIGNQAVVLRGLVETNVRYHRALHERLTKLPEEVGQGIDLKKFSTELAEQIRQQLAGTGLGELADFLEGLMPDLKATSSNLASLIAPVREQSQRVARSLDTEIGKLNTAAASVQGTISQLEAEIRQGITTSTVLMYLLVLTVGFILGFSFEKRSAISVLEDLQSQVQQIQTEITAPPPAASPSTPKRKGAH
jgi:hypothetical protein